MNRRRFLLAGTALLATLPVAGQAQTATDQVISQLRREGYRRISVSRTFLGRVRITARGPAGSREVILNPGTGAVLRDYLRRNDDDRDDDDRDDRDDKDDDRDDSDDKDDDRDDSDDKDDGGDDDGGDDDDDGGDDDGGDDDD
ncbi:hypothetical protein [Thetidibacter halocola]|uniref:PepSY domain-containing protein n=1 Tax=Thetidibacter halocola TaxID=2827239 RepID=A0A8J7WIC9_9RHOB|nr:hypothetical protein [Thetidibacter halocola]MBS0126171.1 hypothetical protein [Thetidibacter halocola]